MIKNHIINLSVISLFLASYTLSQTTITGRVIDSKTDQLLSGANIVLVGADLGTTSNKEGQYQLSIAEPGEYVLRVSFIGYKEAVRNLSLGQNQKLTVNIQLRPTILRGDIVLVTATKTERRLSEIPGRVEVITQEELKSLPSQKLDDVLKYSSGLNVHRTSGIFEIRPVVSLRGVSGDEPGRTLVLVNGVPINKSDTGVANWNRINVNNIKQVEIFKGAGSSLYGNNAMGGVINIITQTPVEKFSGGANVSYGTYNTLSTNFNLSMRKNDKLYFDVDGFYRRSDGYIDLPDTLKTEYTVPLFLDEKGISAQMGFDLNPATSVKVLYDYYDDKRGEGEKIEEVDGKHRHFDTHFFQGKFTRRRENSKYELNGFYQYENYLRVDERITKGEYQKFDVASDRVDKGLLFYYLR
ncbi:MAG: TonB-dependent receptor, partial [Candidatus Marinimicrobia bacterium]|nr:TonB-dependent receptor [Candidatus Neomarinimicrobiota bacterium]